FASWPAHLSSRFRAASPPQNPGNSLEHPLRCLLCQLCLVRLDCRAVPSANRNSTKRNAPRSPCPDLPVLLSLVVSPCRLRLLLAHRHHQPSLPEDHPFPASLGSAPRPISSDFHPRLRPSALVPPRNLSPAVRNRCFPPLRGHGLRAADHATRRPAAA